MTQPEEFAATDRAKAAFPTISASVEKAAFDLAQELIDCGQTPSEAGSIVAHLLLRKAWLVAASCRIADGARPDPEKFRAATESALATYVFASSQPEEKDT